LPEVRIVTPSDPEMRGCQLSLRFEGPKDAEDVLAGLERRGVMCDVRRPNIIRVAPMPLYTSFLDVYGFVEALQSVLSDEQRL
jgi:kynureninase